MIVIVVFGTSISLNGPVLVCMSLFHDSVYRLRGRCSHWRKVGIDVLSHSSRQWSVAKLSMIIVLVSSLWRLHSLFPSWRILSTWCSSVAFCACRDIVAVASGGKAVGLSKVAGQEGGTIYLDQMLTNSSMYVPGPYTPSSTATRLFPSLSGVQPCRSPPVRQSSCWVSQCARGIVGGTPLFIGVWYLKWRMETRKHADKLCYAVDRNIFVKSIRNNQVF